MGSHSLQAVALTVFLIGFTVMCAGMAMGGNILAIAVGIAGLGVSGWLFARCKQLETSKS